MEDPSGPTVPPGPIFTCLAGSLFLLAIIPLIGAGMQEGGAPPFVMAPSGRTLLFAAGIVLAVCAILCAAIAIIRGEEWE